MGIELEDIEFNNYDGFIEWFKELVPESTLKFKTQSLMWTFL